MCSKSLEPVRRKASLSFVIKSTTPSSTLKAIPMIPTTSNHWHLVHFLPKRRKRRWDWYFSPQATQFFWIFFKGTPQLAALKMIISVESHYAKVKNFWDYSKSDKRIKLSQKRKCKEYEGGDILTEIHKLRQSDTWGIPYNTSAGLAYNYDYSGKVLLIRS